MKGAEFHRNNFPETMLEGVENVVQFEVFHHVTY